MKNAVIVGIGIIVGLFFIVFFAYVGIVVYINWPTDRVLATDLMVNNEWTEVKIDDPIIPSHRDQYITLRIKDFKRDTDAKSLDGPLKLSDGTETSPDIELYDSSGTRYEFRHSGSVSKFYEEPVYRPVPISSSVKLPKDRQFTRLRIRADIPFKVDRIAWQDYDPK